MINLTNYYKKMMKLILEQKYDGIL